MATNLKPSLIFVKVELPINKKRILVVISGIVLRRGWSSRGNGVQKRHGGDTCMKIAIPSPTVTNPAVKFCFFFSSEVVDKVVEGMNTTNLNGSSEWNEGLQKMSMR